MLSQIQMSVFLSCFSSLAKPKLFEELLAYAPEVVSTYPQPNISLEMRIGSVWTTI
jgi:hypothetical protein